MKRRIGFVVVVSVMALSILACQVGVLCADTLEGGKTRERKENQKWITERS